ncbi:p58 [Xanthomonas phage Xop411]|uniref:p58 n=1 Tax=Xanthomonas phage Xop411 TaxID=2913975 RepID=A5H1J9_9CAUD|nr:p58 [Xanthomonas phage Xop411]ABK00203.1 p58 [Xanthomonas phage Xop411]
MGEFVWVEGLSDKASKKRYLPKFRRQTPVKDRVHTVEQIRELFTYDPESGDLFWAKARQGVKVGQRAGTHKYLRVNLGVRVVYEPRYIKVMVRDVEYPAHILAWVLTHGVWPVELVHLDGNPTNNRLSNLAANNCKGSAARAVRLKNTHERMQKELDEAWDAAHAHHARYYSNE